MAHAIGITNMFAHKPAHPLTQQIWEWKMRKAWQKEKVSNCIETKKQKEKRGSIVWFMRHKEGCKSFKCFKHQSWTGVRKVNVGKKKIKWRSQIEQAGEKKDGGVRNVLSTHIYIICLFDVHIVYAQTHNANSLTSSHALGSKVSLPPLQRPRLQHKGSIEDREPTLSAVCQICLKLRLVN